MLVHLTPQRHDESCLAGQRPNPVLKNLVWASRCCKDHVMRPPPPTTPAADAVLDGLASHIDKVIEAYQRFGSRTAWRGTGDSPVAFEKLKLGRQFGPGGSWDGADASHAAASAVLFTNQAGLHLEGVADLLRARHVAVPIVTPTRAILELCGHVYWLLDPRIVTSLRRRAARVYLSRLDDVTRAKTAAVAVGHPDAPKIGRAARDLRRVTLPQRFYPSEYTVEPNGEIVFQDDRSPGLGASLAFIEDISGVDWNTPAMYAILSNASHPTLHAVLEGLSPITAGPMDLVDTRWPYNVVRAAVMGFVRSWAITAAYHGLDQEEAGDLGEEMDLLPSPLP